jgi:hypothetical protein
MERSGIQDAPDFAALHPGYNDWNLEPEAWNLNLGASNLEPEP